MSTLADKIGLLTSVLPKGLRVKAERIVERLGRDELTQLLGEVEAAAKVRASARERATAVDQLLSGIAARVGVELSPRERGALRVLLVNLLGGIL